MTIQRAILDYLPYLLESRSLMQLFTVAAATVFVLGPEGFRHRPDMRKLLEIIANIAVLLLSLMLIEVGFLLLSQRIPALRGINFSLTVLCVISIYAAVTNAAAANRASAPERLMLVLVWFATIVVMMEWSAPAVTDFVQNSTGIPGSAMEIVSNLLILLFAVLIRWLSLAEYETSLFFITLTSIEAGLVAISTLFYESLLIGIETEIDDIVQLYIIFVFALMYGINILTYVFSYMAAKDRQSLLDMRIIAQKQQAELELMRLSESNLEELREVRHDIQNHCLYMSSLLRHGRYEELEDYFERFTGKFSNQLFNFMDYGNRVVTAVLNIEQNKAAQMGAKINANIVVPGILPFEENDFCSLSMNLIDNALEECERTQQEKVVNVVMNTRGSDHFYLCVINPTDKAEKDLAHFQMPTSKEDRQKHGYGITIIYKIVQKYNGHFSYHIEDGKFVAEVLLNMSGKEGTENGPGN